MDLYERIDDFLKNIKMSRVELCKRIDVSYYTLSSAYKRKSKNIDSEILIKIANFFNTTLDYLLTGNPDYKEAKKPQIKNDPSFVLALEEITEDFTKEEKDQILFFANYIRFFKASKKCIGNLLGDAKTFFGS